MDPFKANKRIEAFDEWAIQYGVAPDDFGPPIHPLTSPTILDYSMSTLMIGPR